MLLFCYLEIKYGVYRVDNQQYYGEIIQLRVYY